MLSSHFTSTLSPTFCVEPYARRVSSTVKYCADLLEFLYFSGPQLVVILRDGS